ncbi:hypothetical protein Nepgr_033080 [Nepenthes gracilis]|uniref:Uncharacterized protein n=1 Tax=Nepenthes gracilis TaxID=150966 RepID=A0AAD3TKQ9_NEPGR|nr:hypothetical protein Nepgr_033080 [Nepenthes gracilis]
MAHPLFPRLEAISDSLSGNLHQSLVMVPAPNNSFGDVHKGFPDRFALKPLPGQAHQSSSVSWAEKVQKANLGGKVVLGLVKSNDIIIYKDPIESSKTIDEAGFGNEKLPNNHAIESRTGIQLRRDPCPGVSCSNTFAVLHLASDASQLQDTDPPNGNDEEGEISGNFIRAPLGQIITQPCSLDRDRNAPSCRNGYPSTTCVLEDLRSSSDVMVLKELEHKHFPNAHMDPNSMCQGIQPPTSIYSCSNINKLLKGRDPIRVVTKPNDAKHDRTQQEATSFVEMGIIALICSTETQSPNACNGPTHKGCVINGGDLKPSRCSSEPKGDGINGFAVESARYGTYASGGSSSARSGKTLATYKRRKCTESKPVLSEKLSSTSATDSELEEFKMIEQLLEISIHKNSCEQVCDPKINSHSALNDSKDRSYWRNTLEILCQSLSAEEGGTGGIQGCIRDALFNDPQTESINNAEDTADCHEDQPHIRSDSMVSGSVTASEGPAVVPSNGSSSELRHLIITKQCQKAFSKLIMSQKFASLCKLLSENFHGVKVDKILDFSLINSRMKEGAYEQTPTLFSYDIQQFWRKLNVIGSEMDSLARSLSELSRLFCRELAGGLGHGASNDRKDELHAWDSDWRSRLEQADASVYTASTCRCCGEKSDGRDCLVCDSCEELFHVSCIQPAVKEIPHKNWYCSNCTTTSAELLHEDCVVCERLNAAASVGTDEDMFDTVAEESVDELEQSSSCILANGFQVFKGDKKLRCKVCLNLLQNGEVFRVCEHFCRKTYHIRCLTNKQLKSYGPHWYCPCCLCRVCFTDKDDDKVVLCDACDHAYHIYCMNPPLDSIPSGSWFCKKCASGIEAICQAKRVYQNLGEEEKTGAERKRVFTTCRKKSNLERKEDGSGGVDMLLTAANTINYQEELAALYTNTKG